MSKGFTVLELMIVMAVLAIALIAAIAIGWYAIRPATAIKSEVPLVEARDKACTDGCRKSEKPDQCYSGCMGYFQR